MRQFRYQGNFCAECGNPLAQRHKGWLRSWLPRVFCDECVAQLRRRQRLPGHGWLGILLLVAASLFYLLNQPAAPSTVAPIAGQSLSLAAPAATAPAATLPDEAEPALCGARTRKGTPCRRLVKVAGQRCAQHRGQVSLLTPKAPSSTQP